MSNHISPPDVTDRQWDWIKDLIPSAKPGGRPRTLDLRRVINAILDVVVTGVQWRMLPRDDPHWKRAYHYLRQWRADGTWQRIHDTLRAQVRQRAGRPGTRWVHPTAGSLDSQRVKTTPIPGVRGDASGKPITGRKRHLLVDPLGLLRAVVVTAASTSDPAGACMVFKRLGGAGKQLRRIWVDGTDRGQLLAWVSEQ